MVMDSVSQDLDMQVLNKIYKEKRWRGGFCFFEKVRDSDARLQDILTSMN